MLKKIKRKINKAKNSNIGFEELYVDYLLFIMNENIMSEMDYIKTHNKFDIFDLDRWIANMFTGEIFNDNR